MAESADLPDSASSNNNCEDLDGDIRNHVVPAPNHNVPDEVDAKLPDSSSSEGDVLGGKKLQKNDSGIEVEKSPSVSTRDGLSDADGGDSVSECCIDSTGLSHSESVSETKSEDSPRPEDDGDVSFSLDSADHSPNEGNALPDVVDMDTTDGVSSSDAHVDRSDDDGGGDGHNDDDDGGDDDDDDVVADSSAKRKRRHALSSSSDTDSDDENADDDAEGARAEKKKDSDSEDDEKDKDRNDRPWPKHKWRALRDLRKREMGLTNLTPPSYFRVLVQGSLQMAKFMPFSGDCHVVSCARDGQVRLAELSLTGICKGTKKLAQHRGAAHKLALEYDSPHVFLSCGEDALTYQIDLREEKPQRLVVTKENEAKVPLYSIQSNPCNSYEFCTGGRDHYIRIYDKRKIAEAVNGGVVKKFCPDHLENSSVKANVTCACYNFNGTEVLGSYNDEDIYLFDNHHSDGASYIHRYKGHRNNATVKGVNFYGPRSEFIVSGSDCGHVFLWEKETEQIVQFMEADDCGVVNVLEPHPFSPVLATSGLDHDVKIWAPTAVEATRLVGLDKTTRKNRREREDDRYHEPEMIDGQMLWFIMHHFRRSARRRLRQEGEEVSSSSENSDSDSDDEGEGAPPDRMQCQTS
nr:hypothetical protein BaRGS_018866 [Batillaria attramentaria]